MKPGLDFFIGALTPSSVLLDFMAELARPAWVRAVEDDKIVSGIVYDSSGPGSTPTELARLEENNAKVRAACEADADFRAAADRLRGIGVSYQFGGHDDPGGVFAVFYRRGTKQSLAPLEALAADDAGFLDLASRADANARFRTFILRNYHQDYKANRERYPDVGGYPYAPFSSPLGIEPRST